MRLDHRKLFALCAIALLLGAGQTWAAARRTFVASNGIDTGTCSTTAPCRSFGFAITQTLAAGEIVILDSAGYGPVTITQAVAIIAPPGVYAGVTVPSGFNGIFINAGSGDVVTLRGLTINSAGGAIGIVIVAAASVHLENLVVNGFSSHGIDMIASVAVDLFIADTLIRGSKIGMRLQGNNAAGAASVAQVVRTRVYDCVNSGILISDVQRTSIVDSFVGACGTGVAVIATNVSSTNPSVAIDRTVIANAAGDGIDASGTTFTAVVNVGHSVLFGNDGNGVSAGSLGQIRLWSNQITANGLATVNSGGALFTLGDNFRGGNVNGDGDPMTLLSPN